MAALYGMPFVTKIQQTLKESFQCELFLLQTACHRERPLTEAMISLSLSLRLFENFVRRLKSLIGGGPVGEGGMLASTPGSLSYEREPGVEARCMPVDTKAINELKERLSICESLMSEMTRS